MYRAVYLRQMTNCIMEVTRLTSFRLPKPPPLSDPRRIWFIFLWGFRLLLHPLSNYPGPLLAKFSDAYAGFFVLQQRLHLKTYQNHLKYDIYLSDSITKSFVYDLTRQANGIINVFNAIDENIHRRKRKLVGKAIADRAMRAFEPTMAGQIDIFLRRILQSARAGNPGNMTPFIKQLSIDIVGLLGFGYHLNTQTDERDRWLAAGVVKGNFRINSYMNFPGLRHARIDKMMGLLAGKAPLKYGELISRMVKTRLSQPRDGQADLFAYMTDERNLDGDSPVPQSEIFQEAVFFIPAGADTISAAICATLFYLSHHRAAYHRFAKEIRSSFGCAADIRGGPRLAGCLYLRACIDEALRMSPPIGGTLWREQQKTSVAEPLIIDGQVIPPGTQVGVSLYALQHNECYFPAPFIYSPERWLAASDSPGTSSPAKQRKVMPEAFAPFSLGPRSCPGKAMAYLEMSLVLAKLVWYFDFEPAPGKLGEVGTRRVEMGFESAIEYEMHDVFVSSHDGPYLQFQIRGDAYKELSDSDRF
ncbi:cytochrome P450 [Xylariomycetidae sp. FL2044]|nr:cytochrome P450 [Xylariomycetidae sp. FL2044]